MKICFKCKAEKEDSDFYFRKDRNTLATNCKVCSSTYSSNYQKIKKSTFKQRKKEYQNRYRKNKYKTDLNFKLQSALRSRLYSALKTKLKASSVINELGCTIPELKQYLESKFVEGMTWDNYGKKRGCWSVDHIIPISTVDLSNPEQFRIVVHYTNLQPLWHADNIRKSNKT